jgi:hypothetical protein
MREAVRFSGPLKRATVSYEGGRWFVSLMIDTNDVQPVEHPLDVVGVDLGITALATLSTREIVTGPKAHAAALKRLRCWNKALSRKRRGSANFRKVKARLAKLHARITNIRRDATQLFSCSDPSHQPPQWYPLTVYFESGVCCRIGKSTLSESPVGARSAKQFAEGLEEPWIRNQQTLLSPHCFRPKHSLPIVRAARSATATVKWSLKNGRSELIGHKASR